MTIAKLSAIIVGGVVITAGGSAAVATRDKWLPTRSSGDAKENNGEEALDSKKDCLEKETCTEGESSDPETSCNPPECVPDRK